MATEPIKAVEDLLRPFHQAIEAEGITPVYLAKKLKKELNANETKIVKFKGIITDKDLPQTRKGNLKPGIQIIGTSGVIETFRGTGGQERYAGDGETIVSIDQVSWGIRQKARQDTHKLRGDYPAEKHEHLVDTIEDRLKRIEEAKKTKD